LKEVYALWYSYLLIVPKTHRHSLGARIDTLFIQTIEATATASFLVAAEKLPYIKLAIRKLDTLKLLLMILWETKSLETKRYINLSEKLNDTGKMLGGWQGQIKKKTLPK
jgi:hypothetical protein